MNVEVLVYLYVYLCACVILFDLGYLIRVRYTQWSLRTRSAQYREYILGQLSLLEETGCVNRDLQKRTTKELAEPARLIAFMETLEALKTEETPLLEPFRAQLLPEFLFLTPLYRKKGTEYKAYFTYQVAELHFGRGFEERPLVDQTNCSRIAASLLPSLESPSVFERENTSNAIFSLGNVQIAVEAVERLNQNPLRVNNKLLNDGLLSFAGNHAQLAKELLERYDRFHTEVKIIVIDYLRLLPPQAVDQSIFYDMLLHRLEDARMNKEIRLAAVRYFRKHFYAPVLDALLEMVRRPDEQNWEYAAVAASSLGNYPSAETMEVLCGAVSSQNWYVRFNAAESLIGLGVDCGEIISDNMDAYAKGMLLYRREIKRLKERGKT